MVLWPCKGEHQVQTPHLTLTSCPRTMAVNSSLEKGRLFLKTCQRAGIRERRSDRPRRDRQHCGGAGLQGQFWAEHCRRAGPTGTLWEAVGLLPCPGLGWAAWQAGMQCLVEGQSHRRDTPYSSGTTSEVHVSHSHGNTEEERQCKGRQALLSVSGQWWLDTVPTGSLGEGTACGRGGGAPSPARAGTLTCCQSAQGPVWLVLLQAGGGGSKDHF